ncbi:M1 family metallopeptidase [Flavobacterium sp. 3HN19-14]|uniref:M1 family metallopeptidase n=1 Tax=Flavobacterium sp. 3HN19-14 TaxID=3448133 RepID=UPI003EE3CEC9
MEHQSAVAYGNHYGNGYLGHSLSSDEIGMSFDYIIIHESGHEWFGNSITSRDIADMWIHEGFTCYTESVYVECLYGYEKGQNYINGLKQNIANDHPIIGFYGVGFEGSGDMYPKGALMLNTIRSIINDDAKWWKLLLDYSNKFRHQIIDTETVVAFFNKESGLNLTPVFNQYLRYPAIPVLEIKREKGSIQYRWKADAADFNMPVDVEINKKQVRLQPTTTWKFTETRGIKDFKVLQQKFLIDVMEVE